tara:strand:+ start:182 stop:484 length:303 start_codon:yes stop_codon:yes gene_type:complete
MMTGEVLEIFDFNFDNKQGVISIEAQVEDTLMTAHATQIEPEQWTSGRCTGSILWDEPKPPSKTELLNHLNKYQDTQWLLTIPDDSEDLVSFRNMTNYFM